MQTLMMEETMKNEDTLTDTKMKAIVQDSYGTADVLKLAEIDIPTIGDDEVLVHVRAAGVCRGVWHLMTGKPYVIRVVGFGIRAPKMRIPGMDLAGVVEAVGKNVTRLKVGDEVFGTGMSSGTFAEYASLEEDKLVLKPKNVTFEQAVAVPVSGLTGLQAVRDVAKVKAGQKVLVIGASGGVGSFAVQIAKSFGAEVTGVCSTRNLELVRSIGANNIIDYTQQKITDDGQQYDVILDTAGNRPIAMLRKALTPKGTLVIIGGEEGGNFMGGTHRQMWAMAISPFINQKLTTFMSKENQADMRTLADMLEAGQIKPVIDSTYPLAEVPDAIKHLEHGHPSGKIVIDVQA